MWGWPVSTMAVTLMLLAVTTSRCQLPNRNP